MKKLLLSLALALSVAGLNAQTFKGERSVMGSVGYQTNYERFGVGLQGRYAIARNLRIAPDVTFFFPQDKVTGLDVNINFHYLFNFQKDGQGFSVYPLAGFGMQNNFYGEQTVVANGQTMKVDRSNTSKLAFNLGGGITLPISKRSYLNAEAKFMFADEDNLVVMLGYGYKF